MSSAALARVRELVDDWARDFADDDQVSMGSVVTDLRAALTEPTPAEIAGLSPRQRNVLATIRDSMDVRGYPPTLREIGDAVGLTSVSSVAHQLHVLEERGAITRDPNRPRAITVRGGDHG